MQGDGLATEGFLAPFHEIILDWQMENREESKPFTTQCPITKLSIDGSITTFVDDLLKFFIVSDQTRPPTALTLKKKISILNASLDDHLS